MKGNFLFLLVVYLLGSLGTAFSDIDNNSFWVTLSTSSDEKFEIFVNEENSGVEVIKKVLIACECQRQRYYGEAAKRVDNRIHLNMGTEDIGGKIRSGDKKSVFMFLGEDGTPLDIKGQFLENKDVAREFRVWLLRELLRAKRKGNRKAKGVCP